MDDTERRTAKRSRFDQKEPAARSSRFDRRSRSPPPSRENGSRRSRSPMSRDRQTESPAKDARKAAADPAAAAGMLAYNAHLGGCALSNVSHSCRRRPHPSSDCIQEGHPARRCSTYSVYEQPNSNQVPSSAKHRKGDRHHRHRQWRHVHC